MKSFDEGKKIKKMATTYAVAAIMVVASLGLIAVIDDNEDSIFYQEETEAWFWLYTLIVVAIISAGIGGLAMYFWGPKKEVTLTEEYTRLIEAEAVKSYLLSGFVDYRNSLNVIINLWGLTLEHFIRGAEIYSAFLWEEGKKYDANEILGESGVYTNIAYMLVNSSNLVGENFHSLNQRLTEWNTIPVYQNKMTVAWSYGTTDFGSKSAFDGWLTSVASPIVGQNKVFISDGTIIEDNTKSNLLWVSGGQAKITSASGTVITLNEGPNNLDSISSFEPGIYSLETGREYAGSFVRPIDPQACPITSGIVMKAGTEYRLAKFLNNRVSINGISYDKLDIKITPDGGQSQVASIHDSSNLDKSILAKFLQMQQAGNTTKVEANAAASTLWNIYDKAGEASVYLTTLMVPNYYQGISVNAAQKELITLMSMWGLAEFANSSRDKLSANDFKMSSESLNLFVRGDLRKSNGEILYENVIFTPFYYAQDTTLSVGNNKQNQPSIISIWDQAPSLSAWNFTATTETAFLVKMPKDSYLYVYEILFDNNYVSSVFLDVRNIDIIDMERLPTHITRPPSPPGGDDSKMPMIIMIIGFILILIGLFIAPIRPIFYLGLILVIIGGSMYLIDYLFASFSWRNFFPF